MTVVAVGALYIVWILSWLIGGYGMAQVIRGASLQESTSVLYILVGTVALGLGTLVIKLDEKGPS